MKIKTAVNFCDDFQTTLCKIKRQLYKSKLKFMKTKNHKLLFLLSVILLPLCLDCFSQQEPVWTFAKPFGGMTSTSTTPHNVPHHMEMDSKGNVYIFGTYGNMMSIDGEYLPIAGADNTRASFLAKFNCNGELQWSKAVNCQQYDVNSDWMQIKNDTIYIMGLMRFNQPFDTYFLDTMIYASTTQYPYSFPWISNKQYNYFAKISPEGEVLKTHFFHKSNNRPFWFFSEYSPFYISKEKNYYFIGEYQNYSANENTYAFFLDSLPITEFVYNPLTLNYYLFKFDADMSPIWYKKIVDSVPDDYFARIRFYDMVADADDNMYFVGDIVHILGLSVHPYPPGTVYLMDNHTIEFEHHGNSLGFIMKVDSSGTCLWVRQMSRVSDTTVGANSFFISIALNEDDGQLYVSGRGNAKTNSTFASSNYSTFPNGEAFVAPCFDCSGTQNSSYLLAFDKESGDMLWHSTPYTEHANYFGKVEYKSDSIYVGLRWGRALHFQDTIFMHDGSKYTYVTGFSHITYNTQGEMTSVRNLQTDSDLKVNFWHLEHFVNLAA